MNLLIYFCLFFRNVFHFIYLRIHLTHLFIEKASFFKNELFRSFRLKK